LRPESTNPRWKHRPDGSNWGDFGPDDQLGRLNLITPEKVKQGVAEVHAGLVFNLSLPLDYPGGNKLNPRRHPPRLQPTVRNGKPYYVYEMQQDVPGSTDVACDDAVLLHLQYSTQWDSFAHIGSLFDADGDGMPEPVFYNGFRGREEGVQGRAVMIDLRHHFGDTPRKHVGYDDLMQVCERDDVLVEKGDMVCLHTGFADLVLRMQRSPDLDMLQKSCAVLDARCCPSTSCACSSSGSIWASCGISRRSRTGCVSTAARVFCSPRRPCACPARSARR
jgi:hypothetical protein